MAKMCNKEEVDDLNKTITNLDDATPNTKPIPRCESPVFKCFNHKPVRVARLDSSEYDIPSYQVNQSSKTKTCSKLENESHESVLPFSPIFSPFPPPSLSFQFPSSSLSLGKSSKSSLNEQCSEKGPSQKCNIFEALGMTDKDISWVSSMASPPPLQIPGTGFNTIEKATFLPEEKFQNIQPRALFSPSLNEDFGCHPLAFSSDSEDDEAYKSNIRLSDVCATLKQLEVKSLESSQNSIRSSETSSKPNSQELSTSPVLQTKKNKPDQKRRNKKNLVDSKADYEFSVNNITTENTKSSIGSGSSLQNFVDDDSFQSLSFSCIDELCKTLGSVTEQSDLSKTVDFDKTIVNSAISESELNSSSNNVVPKFYSSKTKSNLHTVSELNNLHSYAKALEDGDLSIPEGKTLDPSLADQGIVSLDLLEKMSSVANTAKRLRSELSEEKNMNIGKKAKKGNDTSGWDEMREYLSDSQLNMNESEMFKTVEDLEKTLASQEAKEQKNENQENIQIDTEDTEKFQNSDCGNPKFTPSLECVKFEDKPTVTFTTASGSKISVGDKALSKAKNIFKECDQNVEGSCFSHKIPFSNKIKVSSTALEKAKALMFGEDKSVPKKIIRVSPKALEKAKALWEGNPVVKTAGKIKVSPKALEKAKKMWEVNPTMKSGEMIRVSPEALERGKAMMWGENSSSGNVIKVSPNALEKAKALMLDQDSSKLCMGFSTGSGKTIQVSSKALEKAKALLANCDENPESNMEGTSDLKNSVLESNISNFAKSFKDPTKSALEKVESEDSWKKDNCLGFSTALGNKVEISSDALKKAKALLSDENITERNILPENWLEALPQPQQSFEGFCSASGRKVTISEEALTKAKERAAQWELNNSENSQTIKNLPDAKPSDVTENPSKLTATSEADLTKETNITEGDWDEIIPSWLHAYNTSPSIASVKEDSPTEPEKTRDYVIKSPVLGSSDRFYKKIKRKKLRFDNTENTEKKGSVKRLHSTLPMDFSAPFKKIKCIANEDIPSDVKHRRAQARQEQEKIGKEKEKVKPLKGSHLNKKCTEKQMSFGEAVEGEAPEVYSRKILKGFGVKGDVLNINIENAASFKFNGNDFFGSSCQNNIEGFPVGDGCVLISDDDNKFGVEEFKRAFLASPGVQPNLLPSGWLQNHYKWIVWKLAHYEKSFPRFFGGSCLTPHNVMLQLKYRYDREIDRNERSALKKILERDDTSLKRLVLCICGIKKIISGEFTDYELNLTDGWYSCPARSDPAMKRLVEKGKLSVGTKLVTQGAVLLNCDQGISPLEMNGDVYLKISTNSTRRIRWDAKLGFQKNPESIAVSLGSILPQGGSISRLDVIIVRIYPVLYMEKTSDGHHVTRNLRSEEKAIAEFQKIQEQRMEKICNELQSEMQKSTAGRKSLQRESDEGVKDIAGNFHARQSDLSKKLEQELTKEKLNKRNVSEFLRVKIVDLRKPDYNNPALLTVWNPNEEVIGLFTEGKVISLRGVGVSNSSRVQKSMQINTTRQTQYKQISRNVKYPARQLTRLKDVSSKLCPVFEEVDLVGVVIKIQDVSYGSRLTQIIYLTDLESNFVGIFFWGSCKDYGWENVLTIRSIVACSNLQWKKNYTVQEVPSLHVSENSVFTENPKHHHLKEELERLKKIIPQDTTVFSDCEEELTLKLEESKWQKERVRAVNGFESKPTASSTPIKPFPAGLTSEEAEPSPIQKRIEKLQSYGEPPPLMHLKISNLKPKKKL